VVLAGRHFPLPLPATLGPPQTFERFALPRAKSHGRSAYIKRGCRCEICVAAQRGYYQANKDKIKSYARRYHQDNKERLLDDMREYRENNPEKFKKDTPERRVRHRESQQKRRALLLEAFVEEVDNTVVFEKFDYVCQGCGITCDKDAVWPAKNFPTLDHIIPISKGGEHSYSNTELLCLPCNAGKRDRVIERLAKHG
jgi:5-methylcytosine-specific restriction endonuclease McrA